MPTVQGGEGFHKLFFHRILIFDLQSKTICCSFVNKIKQENNVKRLVHILVPSFGAFLDGFLRSVKYNRVVVLQKKDIGKYI